MNNDLSFWRKLVLSLNDEPKTDADIAWLYRKIARPEIPASALWDAEKGAMQYLANHSNENYDLNYSRKHALDNRGWGTWQTEKDMPYRTPTGAIMEQLLNPDMLIVPKKEDMSDIWR